MKINYELGMLNTARRPYTTNRTTIMKSRRGLFNFYGREHNVFFMGACSLQVNE